MLDKIRNNFLAGVFTFLPLFLTFYLVYIIGAKLNSLVIKITPKIYHPIILDDTYGILVRLFIFLILLGCITILGFFTKIYLGKVILKTGDKIITRIPILNKIYTTITQINKAVFGQKEKIFRKVVLLEYPRKGIYAIGFLTAEMQVKIKKETCQKCFNIFIPTTPNPTSGMLIIATQDEIIDINISVEDGMKLIISGGVVFPEYKE